MSEKQEAWDLAQRVLDKPYLDPDGDICLLARQFIRTVEGARAAIEDQIKYCSNGSRHITAVEFLECLPDTQRAAGGEQ